MKTCTAMLVATCLAIAAFPDRGAAQDPYYPGFGDGGAYPGVGYYSEDNWDSPRVWGSAEYLLSFRKSRQVPPLVTTNPPGTPLADAGVLDAPSTTTLFGGEGLVNSPRSGVRGEVGIWLDQRAGFGVGAAFMGLEQESVSFFQSSDGSDILARPIFDTLWEEQKSFLVAYPGLVRGTVSVASDNDVWGAEIFLRKEIGFWPLRNPLLFGLLGARSFFIFPERQVVSIIEHGGAGGVVGASRCDFLIGYQFSRIEDSLRISNRLVSLDPAYLGQIGTTLDAFDSFDTRNDFHGMTLGLKSVSYYGPWSLTLLGKVGLGDMHQTATVNGQTVITPPGGPSATTPAALLSQPSNIGTYSQDRFGVIPEARITLNYNVTRRLSVGVGYSFIYWNCVAFAGRQVDTRVDVSDPQVLPDPTFDFRETDSFVHAVMFQVQLNN